MVQVNCIDHIDFMVKNPKDYIRIFQMLGFKIVSETTHRNHSWELQLPGKDYPIIEVHGLEGTHSMPGIQHIGLQVDDVKKACEELRAQGLEFEDDAGIQKTSHYPYYVKETGRTIGNFRFSDGLKVQLVDPKREDVGEHH